MKWPTEQPPRPEPTYFILWLTIFCLLLLNGLVAIWGSSQFDRGYIAGREQGQQDKRDGYFYKHKWWLEDSAEYYRAWNEKLHMEYRAEIDRMIAEADAKAIAEGKGW
jgi:hypothetical protein